MKILTVFQDIEKLIYKVLMWIILIPKTIVKITLNPFWAPGYVKEEIEKDESPFDEYVSPVILLLVVALIPALALGLLPNFGAVISSPAQEKTTTDRFLSFDVQTDFKSASPRMQYIQVWTVEKIGENNISLPIYSEKHYPGSEANFFEKIDNNTVQDHFLYTFPDPGEYYVNVLAGKYDPQRFDPQNETGLVTESYYAYLKVTVPVKIDDPILISTDAVKSSVDIKRGVSTLGDTIQVKSQQGPKNFADLIVEEKNIFLALALMIPPLLFAFATKILREGITEDSLKENFYVQCYYFSPLSLAIWATVYAVHFFTADAYFYWAGDVALQIIFLPSLLSILWFIRTEVKAVAYERKTGNLFSFLIVITCIVVLGFAANVVFSFIDYEDVIRLWAIRIFPLASAALIIAFGVAWYKRRADRRESITVASVSWIAIGALVLLGVLRIISLLVFPESPASSAVPQATAASAWTSTPEIPATQPITQPTQTLERSPSELATPTAESVATQSIAEPTQTIAADTATPEPQPFYTEDFNGDIANWFSFMTSGDPRMVDQRVELGKLSIHLKQLEDKLPWYYLIRDTYTYFNVKVEAVVTNRGNNANGVSLICRYSDIGWYEFEISNSGTYTIYAVDNAGVVNQGYNNLFDGGSPMINTGLSTNVYTAECRDNALSLFVNQTPVRTITDDKFKFSDGKIGIAVSSPRKLPVTLEFETITVSEP